VEEGAEVATKKEELIEVGAQKEEQRGDLKRNREQKQG